MFVTSSLASDDIMCSTFFLCCRLTFLSAEDFSHHIGASVLLLTKSVKFLYNKPRDMPIEDVFTQVCMYVCIVVDMILRELFDANLVLCRFFLGNRKK